MKEPDVNHEHFRNEKVFTLYEEPTSGPLKHSGVGITSFVLSLVSFVAYFGVTIGFIVLISNEINLMTLFDSNEQLTMTQEELTDKIKPLFGYLIMYPLVLILNIVGLILGIVGLARQGANKVFPVLGTVINGIVFLAVFLLTIIAFAQGNL